MNIILITIGVLLTIELGLIMFCEYWRENNPWKWFFVKTLTTLLIVFYILHNKEMINGWDLGVCALLGVCLGIDIAYTVMDAKKNNYDF
mgnify:CR=1 FL=1